MDVRSTDDLLIYFKENKNYFHDQFGVSRIGIFGSFAKSLQGSSSDIDIVLEIEKDRKNIHNFLRFKRFLENELGRKIDLGFEGALKPAVRESIKEQIIYA